MSWSWKHRLRLPSRVALLFGLGALSAAGARADTAEIGFGSQPEMSPQPTSLGQLRIWSDGGRIYLANPGSEARELRLTDSPEAQHLKQMLERDDKSTAGIRLGPTILAGSGGGGFHWAPATGSERRTAPSVSNSLDPSQKASAPAAPSKSHKASPPKAPLKETKQNG